MEGKWNTGETKSGVMGKGVGGSVECRKENHEVADWQNDKKVSSETKSRQKKETQMKTFTFALVVGAAFFLSSCSTSVQIASEPQGADVEINGQAQGKTPLSITLSDLDWTQYNVTLRKLGYQDKTVVLEKELKAGPFIGGFFIWPFWVWCYGPMDNYNFQLIPKTGQ